MSTCLKCPEHCGVYEGRWVCRVCGTKLVEVQRVGRPKEYCDDCYPLWRIAQKRVSRRRQEAAANA